MTSALQIFTNATSGDSSEFQLPDGSVIFKLSIVGISSNLINAFVTISTTANNLYLTIEGLSGSGATINLLSKANHPNASFINSGRKPWSQDYSGYHHLQSRS